MSASAPDLATGYGPFVAIRVEAKRLVANDPSLAELTKHPSLQFATLVLASLVGRDADERTCLLGAAALCALRLEAIERAAEAEQRRARTPSSRPPPSGARSASERPGRPSSSP